MKKWIALLLTIALFLPLFPAAAETVIINKITDPENNFTFPEDAKLLEIYIPKIYDCFAAYIRYGEYSMLFDCGGVMWEETDKMLKQMGVTELTYAFNSHPHTDHIHGFQHVLKTIPAQEFVLAFDEDYAYSNTIAFTIYEDLHEMGVPFHRVYNGDILPFGDVKATVIQRHEPALSGNNLSAMLKLELGERSFLFASDIQADAQLLYVDEKVPVQADILQHPHHGYNRMQYPFMTLVDPELVIVTSQSAYANGVDYLKYHDIAYHYTNLGVMRMTTDGNVWLIERIK